MTQTDPILYVPTHDEVVNLKVGDLALNPFGKYAPVVEIFGQGDDIHGKAFVCYFTSFGDDNRARISNSMKQDEIVVTVAASVRYTSAQLHQIERKILKERMQ